MKEDLGELPPVPKKRRQLELALDVWIAMWLASDDLTPSERRRVQQEKDHRKQARRSGPAAVVGFTGTRAGLTPQQRTRIEEIVEGAAEGHHGDCIGGDEQFHKICRKLGIPVVLHPPTDGRLRAYCQGAIRSEKAKPYLERNKDIVRETTTLVGAPKEPREPPPARGQGTWSTIRYARSRGDRPVVVLPDGSELGEDR